MLLLERSFLRICEEKNIVLPDVKIEDIDVEDEL